MRNVCGISQQQLERMAAGWQSEHHLSLTIAKMNVVVIRGNGLVKIGVIGVDEQMVMTRPGLYDTSGRDAHCTQAYPDCETLRDANTVDRIMEIDLCPFGGRCAPLGERSLLRTGCITTATAVLGPCRHAAASQQNHCRRQNSFHVLEHFSPPKKR